MNYRALILDLDGTLLSPDGTVSDRNRRAVLDAVAEGWHVVVATARWFRHGERTAEAFGLVDPLIASSGADVRRLRDGATLFDRRLPATFAAELYALCDQVDGMAYIYQDDEVLFRNPEGSARAGLDEVRGVTSLAGADPSPRCALVYGEQLTELVMTALQPTWQGQVRFLNSLSGRGSNVLTITSQGADKGLALQVACADLGIDLSQAVAMGDSETDIEMFRVAGASVAMGQATDDVRAAATWVTAANTDDGVARAIEHLLAGSTPAACG